MLGGDQIRRIDDRSAARIVPDGRSGLLSGSDRSWGGLHSRSGWSRSSPRLRCRLPRSTTAVVTSSTTRTESHVDRCRGSSSGLCIGIVSASGQLGTQSRSISEDQTCLDRERHLSTVGDGNQHNTRRGLALSCFLLRYSSRDGFLLRSSCRSCFLGRSSRDSSLPKVIDYTRESLKRGLVFASRRT